MLFLSLGYSVSPTVLDLLVSKFDKTRARAEQLNMITSLNVASPLREFAHCFYISSQLCFIWRRLGLDLQHAPVLETETGLGMAWISRKRWQMRQASTTMERRDASGAAYYEQWSEHGGGSYGDGGRCARLPLMDPMCVCACCRTVECLTKQKEKALVKIVVRISRRNTDTSY
ncbi:uncharacterized protein LOC120702501 isoform X2 [Panicum virgatum]|nr:uncharacterized protein LOC120702501 isoform X2 [Panicum virgatum]XP_039842266.1 uncharacterized protein LOC120702501 isoform X2 [Panicum virgatum]